MFFKPTCAILELAISNVRRPGQITETLQRAKQTGALVVYTLVDLNLQQLLVSEAIRLGVQAVDVMGPILTDKTIEMGSDEIIRHLTRRVA